MSNKELKIFLSYSWADFEHASIIDTDLSSMGIKITRDIRDIDYMGSIPNFMQQVNESDFVILLLSESYLRSENCMYESLELLNSHKFDQKVLPISLPPVSFYKPESSILFYQFWDEKIAEANKHLEKYPDRDILEVLKKRKAIRNSIDEIILLLKTRLIKSFTEIKSDNYGHILQKIGFDEKMIWQEILKLQGKSFEEVELHFEELEQKWPKNRYIALTKAAKAQYAGYKLKAEKYYKDALSIHPNFPLLLNDFADFLISIKKDYVEAEKFLLRTIELDPTISIAWNNYGLVIEKLYNDRLKAFEFYRKAIDLDINNSYAHRNLGLEYIERKDKINGLKHLQLSVKIDPFYAEAHFDLGVFYIRANDRESALKHFKSAVELRPSYNAAKHSLAMLLGTEFRNFAESKSLFEQLLQSEPENPIYHLDFAFYCLNPMGNWDQGMQHITYAMGIDHEAVIRRTAEIKGDDPEEIIRFMNKKKN